MENLKLDHKLPQQWALPGPIHPIAKPYSEIATDRIFSAGKNHIVLLSKCELFTVDLRPDNNELKAEKIGGFELESGEEIKCARYNLGQLTLCVQTKDKRKWRIVHLRQDIWIPMVSELRHTQDISKISLADKGLAYIQTHIHDNINEEGTDEIPQILCCKDQTNEKPEVERGYKLVGAVLPVYCAALPSQPSNPSQLTILSSRGEKMQIIELPNEPSMVLSMNRVWPDRDRVLMAIQTAEGVHVFRQSKRGEKWGFTRHLKDPITIGERAKIQFGHKRLMIADSPQLSVHNVVQPILYQHETWANKTIPMPLSSEGLISCLVSKHRVVQWHPSRKGLQIIGTSIGCCEPNYDFSKLPLLMDAFICKGKKWGIDKTKLTTPANDENSPTRWNLSDDQVNDLYAYLRGETWDSEFEAQKALLNAMFSSYRHQTFCELINLSIKKPKLLHPYMVQVMYHNAMNTIQFKLAYTLACLLYKSLDSEDANFHQQRQLVKQIIYFGLYRAADSPFVSTADTVADFIVQLEAALEKKFVSKHQAVKLKRIAENNNTFADPRFQDVLNQIDALSIQVERNRANINTTMHHVKSLQNARLAEKKRAVLLSWLTFGLGIFASPVKSILESIADFSDIFQIASAIAENVSEEMDAWLSAQDACVQEVVTQVVDKGKQIAEEQVKDIGFDRLGIDPEKYLNKWTESNPRLDDEY